MKKVIWEGYPFYGAFTRVYEDLSIEVPGYNDKYVEENYAADVYKVALKDVAKERDNLKEAARKVI